MKITKHPNVKGNGTIGLTDENRRSIAFVWDFEDANDIANLFAAAPDLLAVCENIKQYLDFVSNGQPTHGTVERELYYKLQAAIAAAKGEQ